MAGLERLATNAPMYRAARTRARPPQTVRFPAGATVPVEGGHSYQGRDLPAVQRAQLRQVGQERKDDQPPFPTTLFVVDTEEVEATYVRTAARMSRMSLPIFASCIPALSHTGILGTSWRPLWEPESPRLPLSALHAYQWDSLYHRMRHRPVGGNR